MRDHDPTYPGVRCLGLRSPPDVKAPAESYRRGTVSGGKRVLGAANS
jgi:hypothetical protein